MNTEQRISNHFTSGQEMVIASMSAYDKKARLKSCVGIMNTIIDEGMPHRFAADVAIVGERFTPAELIEAYAQEYPGKIDVDAMLKRMASAN